MGVTVSKTTISEEDKKRHKTAESLILNDLRNKDKLFKLLILGKLRL